MSLAIRPARRSENIPRGVERAEIAPDRHIIEAKVEVDPEPLEELPGRSEIAEGLTEQPQMPRPLPGVIPAGPAC